ncbi:radical SAM protein [Wukongibacter baidiensis]|uniref:radical SAM protein n=1 Tax=Wukongibacter baidiensis TaxID=1723361 RepID=UPI003D7F5199
MIIIRYEGVVYRPPSEFDSIIIQATLGCPHNKCNFCNMYKGRKFRIRTVKEIKEDLLLAKQYYGNALNKIFFSDGNTILMKTKDLLEILNYANELFPDLERITMYGSSQYINLKSLDELKALNRAGLTRLHSGMESGDDEVLKFINKGVNSKEAIKAGKLIKEAGITLSLYYIVGVGGLKLSNQHAISSAKVLNEINPDFIRFRTFMPLKNTPMYEMYKENKFHLLSPHEALKETKLLVENLEGISSTLVSDHMSNHWDVSGRLPEDKDHMLSEIDYALSLDISNFRSPENGSL